MINSIGSSLVYTPPTDVQQSSQTQGIAALLAATTDSGSSGVTSTGSVQGDSATISGPGKLFSELQQLQSQDPAKFKEVVSDIATKLQTAAQQTTGTQADFLTNLASKFQTAASTGDVSSLQPPKHHHPHGTYNQQGQIASPAPATPGSTVPAGAPTAAAGTNLEQLFTSISQEVSQAVGA